jgi:TRAP-type C4-dicarboxylate transport system substrate-binding protein
MNKAKYNSLPADLKKVIDNNSGIEFSAMAGRMQESDDAPGRQQFRNAGVTINTIPAAELAKWKKATDSLDDEWMANATKAGHDGPKLYKAAQDLIKKHTK